MKSLLKVMAALCFATICAGFMYAHHKAEEAKFETIVVHDRVHAGDTFNDIIAHYYNPENEKECWAEWSYHMQQRNKKLFFKEDGSARMLQPGDIVCMEVRVLKVAK